MCNQVTFTVSLIRRSGSSILKITNLEETPLKKTQRKRKNKLTVTHKTTDFAM